MMNIFRSKRLAWLTGKRFFSGCQDLDEIFSKERDRYGGIHYDTNRADPDSLRSIGPERLTEMIFRAMQMPNSECRTLWFRIPPANSLLIETLVKLGFGFHHVKDGNVIMYKPLTERDNVPRYAYTQVGVGGLVVDDQDRVLVVQEKAHMMKNKFWKLPGGYVEQGEDLDQAVCREVFEETGIHTEFKNVLLMRHMHNVPFSFGCSDFYFVCCLRPVTQGEEITMCPHEIEKCQWIPLNEIQQENFSIFNNFIIQKYLEWRNNQTEIGYDKVESNFFPVIYNVYSIKQKK